MTEDKDVCCRSIAISLLAIVSAPDPTDAAADGLHHRYASVGVAVM